MSYYIKAHKGMNSLSIPVEEKHLYKNIAPTFIKQSQFHIESSGSPSSLQDGYVVTNNNVQSVWDTNAFVLSQGTSAQSRIGDKVMLKSVKFDFNLSFDYRYQKELIMTNYVTMPTWAKYRLMIVHFDQSMTNSDIARWYRFTYVPDSVTGDSSLVMSNQCQTLRESTTYTGKFKILHDQIIELTTNMNQSKHIVISLKPHKNITFNSSGDPTNDDFINTYCFLIKPSYYQVDMDPVTYDKISVASTVTPALVHFAQMSGFIKYTYYDI